jgi:hypothetical protein
MEKPSSLCFSFATNKEVLNIATVKNTNFEYSKIKLERSRNMKDRDEYFEFEKSLNIIYHNFTKKPNKLPKPLRIRGNVTPFPKLSDK